MAVPSAHEPLVRKFRRFIKDTANLNGLLEEEENTDEFLYDCITDTIDEINLTYIPMTSYTLTDISTETAGVPWILVRMGATLQYLSGAGIHSAHNTFTYSDGSGIQVQDTDAYGRYINLYNVLLAKYQNALKNWKMNKNIEDCYGGHHSEYNNLWD